MDALMLLKRDPSLKGAVPDPGIPPLMGVQPGQFHWAQKGPAPGLLLCLRLEILSNF